MAAMGDMVSNALLPYLDYEYLVAPKSIVGHSDITALLLGAVSIRSAALFWESTGNLTIRARQGPQPIFYMEVLSGKKIPILADVDCCHTIPLVTLPIGAEVRLDAEKQEIIFL